MDTYSGKKCYLYILNNKFLKNKKSKFMNFRVSSTPNSVTISHPATKSKLTVTVDGKNVTREKVSNFATKREQDCATHLHKFMATALSGASIIKGNLEKKINTLVDTLKEYGHLNQMRTLNNTVRRAFDPGTKEYFAENFYEGTPKYALKVFATPATKPAPVAKKAPAAKATPTPTKKATPAKKAPVATAPKEKAPKKAKATPTPVPTQETPAAEPIATQVNEVTPNQATEGTTAE